jgi:hypothetical protein
MSASKKSETAERMSASKKTRTAAAAQAKASNTPAARFSEDQPAAMARRCSLLRRLRCILVPHQWHSSYDHKKRQTTWTCSRCGAHKIDPFDSDPDLDSWGTGGMTGGTGV